MIAILVFAMSFFHVFAMPWNIGADSSMVFQVNRFSVNSAPSPSLSSKPQSVGLAAIVRFVDSCPQRRSVFTRAYPEAARLLARL